MAELKTRATLDGAQYFGTLNKMGGMADRALGGIKSQIAAAFTVGAITAFSRKTIEYADNVEELSQRIGISAKALQEWGFAAKQNGTDTEKLVTFIERLTNAAQDLDNLKGFQALGINPNGMTPESLFSAVQSRTAGKGATEVQAMMQSIGLGVKQIGPMMNVLQADLSATSESAARLGAVMDQQTVHALAAMNDQLSIVGQVLMGQFAPALLAGGKAAIELFGILRAGSNFKSFLNPIELGKLVGGDPEARGRYKSAVKEARSIDRQTQAMIEAISNYRAAPLPTVSVGSIGGGGRSRSNSDSLASVGNFLGSGRSAINSLMQQQLQAQKETAANTARLVDVMNSINTIGTIFT